MCIVRCRSHSSDGVTPLRRLNCLMKFRREQKPQSAEIFSTVSLLSIRRAADRVRENTGKVAIQRGPPVYCVEELDNGTDLHQLIVDPTGSITEERDDNLMEGSVAILLDGYRDESEGSGDALYFDYRAGKPPTRCKIRAIPYYQWGNRAPNQEMRVWLRVRQ